MLPGMEMMACPNLAVPAEVMQHVVAVESGRNPFAIGVVGGQLVRQPQNLGEAVATVRMLEARGYNFSLGIAQVNRANLGKYGLDTYEKAFEVCPNLAAGARILADCYASSGGDWGKSFSCYYSGNFVTGYQDGYVQKVYDSISRGANAGAAMAIPLQRVSSTPASPRAAARGAVPAAADSAAYRISMRSVLDTVAAAAVTPAVGAELAPHAANAATGAAVVGAPAAAAPPMPPVSAASGSAAVAAAAAAQAMAATAQAAPPGASAQPVAAAPATASNNEVFVPQVRGPGDSPSPPSAPGSLAAAPAPSSPAVDRADLRQGARDDAFVF
ncbi:lytic transglycosylase domain-containing protein [Frateuria defendens]|uniref:lytic transglycosylase domain-containing protein n=1 Tax=Frateuria defendens TaxID=2219559 RepID=UPI0009E4669B